MIRQHLSLQPSRDEQRLKGLAVSRHVIGVAIVSLLDVKLNGERVERERLECHVLACHHLAPVESADGVDPAKVQKRRCVACAVIERERPKVKTLIVRKPARKTG